MYWLVEGRRKSDNGNEAPAFAFYVSGLWGLESLPSMFFVLCFPMGCSPEGFDLEDQGRVSHVSITWHGFCLGAISGIWGASICSFALGLV